MQLQIKAQHETVPESAHAYAEKRLGKLARRLYAGTLVEVTMSRQNNPSIRNDHTAEAVVHTKGPSIVAHHSAETHDAPPARPLHNRSEADRTSIIPVAQRSPRSRDSARILSARVSASS